MVKSACWRVLTLAALACGCTGELTGGGGTLGSAGPGSGSGPASSTGGPPTDPASVADCKGFPLDPGPSPMRRLTNREYAASVLATLSVDASRQVETFPADPVSEGFDNSAASQTLSVVHGERYLASAQALAQQIVTDPALQSRVVGCDPAADRAACLKGFAGRLGLKLFRRPLETDELDDYVSITDVEPDGYQAASMLIEAMLQSPNFLFRPEVGVADAARPDLLRLSGFEIATRLSYFLAGKPPSGELMASAQKGELDTPEGVQTAAQALLADDAAKSAFRDMTGQWFRTNALVNTKRSSDRFPEFGPELVSAMQGELSLLLDELMWTPGTNFLDLYTTRHGYVNDVLAPIYGVTAPSGADLRLQDFGDDPNRGGLFTTAGFLTASTRSDSTSPIQRGKYVREVVLCDPPQSPPPNVPALMPDPNESQADAEERHTKEQPCASCHMLIDPIGHGLERYDSIGKLRDTYITGQPVRETGNVAGIDASDFGGGVELGKVLAGSDMTPRCVVLHTFRWALGRSEKETGANDACTTLTLGQRFSASSGSFSELVVSLVTSDVFRYRRLPTEKP